jgi:hypothetical protein
MKASEIIKRLQDAISDVGDIEVGLLYKFNDNPDSPREFASVDGVTAVKMQRSDNGKIIHCIQIYVNNLLTVKDKNAQESLGYNEHAFRRGYHHGFIACQKMMGCGCSINEINDVEDEISLWRRGRLDTPSGLPPGQ